METVVNDIRMYWREAGRGAPVVFIHGFPFHSGLWSDQLDRLPRRWRWIAPDLRGFGGTRAEAGEEGLSMEAHAEDLVDLLDALEIQRAVICGLSMGGYVAFALWRAHADRVRALVLCSTRAAADTDDARRARYGLAARIRREGAAAVAEVMLPTLLSEQTRRERPEVVQRVREMIEATPRATLVAALMAMAERPDSTPLLPTIDVPTLVLRGSEDAIIPAAEAERMAEEIPDARLRVIDGAGHVPNLEQPAEFDRELVLFLEAIEGE
ncbi:MAG TPA: alpha/beta fold hydrolase [Longimicrobiales bacterium]